MSRRCWRRGEAVAEPDAQDPATAWEDQSRLKNASVYWEVLEETVRRPAVATTAIVAAALTARRVEDKALGPWNGDERMRRMIPPA